MQNNPIFNPEVDIMHHIISSTAKKGIKSHMLVSKDVGQRPVTKLRLTYNSYKSNVN